MKTYLRWHLFRVSGNELGQKFVVEKFKWRAALTGAEKLPARWKRCVRAIDGGMGEALGQPFVDMDVSKIIESAKSGAQSTIGELRGSLGPDGPAANQERIAKFKKMLQENLALASFGL